MSQPVTALVIMGVAGCGKTSVSEALCRLNGATAIEGDSFHPAANIEKMSAGHPLNDDDRAGWLDILCDELRRSLKAGEHPVLTCSALKKKYRDHLREAAPGLGFVFLELTREVASDRVSHRPDHFMPASLIDRYCGRWSTKTRHECPHRDGSRWTPMVPGRPMRPPNLSAEYAGKPRH